MKTILMLVMLTGLVAAQEPGDHYPPGDGGPVAGNEQANRTITVYGNVTTNDFLIFMDRSGNKVRGTNAAQLVAANINTNVPVQIAAATNAMPSQWRADITNAVPTIVSNAFPRLLIAVPFGTQGRYSIDLLNE